jgi:polyphosphate kinase 2 (PPK2 family)
LAGQHLPDSPETNKDFWKQRYKSIRDWEDHLAANGTHVIKFFLHVSLEEQKQRFLDRIDEPEKNWKFSAGDAKERGFWDDYMKAYTEVLSATSTDRSPWYIIPADKKWFTRLAVSEVIVQKLDSLNLKYPTVTEAQKAELIEAKKILENES